MEYHRDPYGKQRWILGSKDIKRIKNYLKEFNEEYSPYEYDGSWYTNWQILCYRWNRDNGLFPEPVSLTDYYYGKYDNVGSQLSNAYVPSTQTIPETWNCELTESYAKKQAFRTGDIVNVIVSNAYPDSIYVVREAVLIDIGVATKYIYDVSPINSDDKVYTYEEHELQFQYHDDVWEKYFTETIGSGLPEWRGELYNICLFYRYSWKSLHGALIEKYNNDTIPPVYMKYILESHSIYERLDIILTYDNRINADIIMENLGISFHELTDLIWSIQEKLSGRNETDALSSEKERQINNDKYKFNERERALASEINALDFETDKNKVEVHFPLNLTNLQIMDAIKDAYNHAHKAGPIVMRVITDRRYGMPQELTEPKLGRILYEGYSAKYDLDIRFQYNFDLDLIETAYPVRMNNNVKKDEA